MAGRRPKPNHLHVVTGTGRADRHSLADGPQATADPPEHMARDARDFWRLVAPIVYRMGVLTEADLVAFERLCQCYAEIRQCECALELLGTTYETKTVSGEHMVRARPERAMLADADRRFRSYLVEFGLTPAAQTKVKTDNGDKKGRPGRAILWLNRRVAGRRIRPRRMRARWSTGRNPLDHTSRRHAGGHAD